MNAAPRSCLAFGLKLAFGWMASAFAETLLTFLMMLLIFGSVLIDSALFHPVRATPAQQSDMILVSFAVSVLVATYTIPAAMMHAALLGLLATIIGRRPRLFRWWIYTIFGAISGIIPMGFYFLSDVSPGISSPVRQAISVYKGGGMVDFITKELLAALVAASGGFTFWLVWSFFDRLFAADQAKAPAT